MSEPLAMSIFLDCSKCGARLIADFEASGYVDGIIVQVEPCKDCIYKAEQHVREEVYQELGNK